MKKFLSLILAASMALSVVAGIIPVMPKQGVAASEHPVWQDHEHNLDIYEVCSSCGIGKCGDDAYYEFNPETGELVVFGSGALFVSAFDSSHHNTGLRFCIIHESYGLL